MSTQNDPEFDKLRRLLALKRYEKPHPGYFTNFLDEFHRRQRIEPIRRLGWWAQMAEFFRSEPLVAARYALGTAAVLLLCVNMFLLTHQSSAPTNTQTAAIQQPFTPQPPPAMLAEHDLRPMVVASNNQQNLDSHYILDRVNVAPVNYEPRGDF